MNSIVLLVDDEPNVLRGYQRNIGEMFECEAVASPQEALERIMAEDKYALIMTDYRMPGMTGVELLRKARELRPNTVRMLITGYADVQISLEAINEGSVFRMLTKPCDPQAFYRAIEDGIRQHELITAEKELLEQTLNGSVKMLGDIMSVMDQGAFGRSHKMSQAARAIGQAMGIEALWELEVSATLSEIGRVTLPGEVSGKRIGVSQLSDNELKLLQKLPEFSAKLISRIPRLEPVAQNVLYQNKNFDGSGFPIDGLRGEYLPVGARILKFIEDLSMRVEKAHGIPESIMAMAPMNSHYDPQIIEAALRIIPELNRIFSSGEGRHAFLGLKDLKEGYRLISNIETKDGVLIITAGNVIRPAILQRILNFATIMPIKEPIEVALD